jgi:hypothetical protein
LKKDEIYNRFAYVTFEDLELLNTSRIRLQSDSSLESEESSDESVGADGEPLLKR